MPFDQLLLILGEAEEVSVLGQVLEPGVALGILRQLVFRHEAVVGGVVPAGILVFIDVASLMDERHHGLHCPMVLRRGGAEELVGADLQQLPGIHKIGDETVAVLTRRDPFGGGFVGDPLAVLVGPGDQAGIHPVAAMKAGQNVA
jgi:hypothetical protein